MRRPDDVTARDLQGKYSQWLIGKSQDTFCPMGPWAVTRDEFDLANAGLSGLPLPMLRPESALLLELIPSKGGNTHG